jgi:hypothetical protein
MQIEDKSNRVLIGMPGSGKKRGVIIFLDVDMPTLSSREI